jgi:hypothetical protein
MKHGQEKSDLFVVAMKPANKPGRLGAELVEPRERTEGNTREQHTRRTLRRVSVSQRLDRVRALLASFFVSHPRWRPGKTGGYAAFASHVSCIPGYQRDSVERQSSFKTRGRTWSNRWAPQSVHLICCFFTMRLLTT